MNINNGTCERCTDIVLKFNSNAPYLCEECFDVLGTKPQTNMIPCHFCGSTWVDDQELICPDCFRDEPVYVQTAQ